MAIREQARRRALLIRRNRRNRRNRRTGLRSSDAFVPPKPPMAELCGSPFIANIQRAQNKGPARFMSFGAAAENRKMHARAVHCSSQGCSKRRSIGVSPRLIIRVSRYLDAGRIMGCPGEATQSSPCALNTMFHHHMFLLCATVQNTVGGVDGRRYIAVASTGG